MRARPGLRLRLSRPPSLSPSDAERVAEGWVRGLQGNPLTVIGNCCSV